MKVKNVVAIATRLILNGELATKIENGTTLTTDEQEEANKLLRAFNLTLNEVATEYLSTSAEERKYGSAVNFSSLSHTPSEIRSVKGENGDDVSFKVLSDKIKIYENGWHYIRYNYLPSDRALTDDFDYENSKVGARAFAYGTASEYLLMSGRYEEAQNYRIKFEKSATSPLTKTVRKIKGRIWG